MAIPNLILPDQLVGAVGGVGKEEHGDRFAPPAEKIPYTPAERELVDRLNKAFPEDKHLHALLDLLLNQYADLVTCDCGRKAFLEIICSVCDRDE